MPLVRLGVSGCAPWCVPCVKNEGSDWSSPGEVEEKGKRKNYYGWVVVAGGREATTLLASHGVSRVATYPLVTPSLFSFLPREHLAELSMTFI